MTYQMGLTHGVMIACLFCAVVTYIHYRGLYKKIEQLTAQYKADLALADRRCAQLMKANQTLSARNATLEKANQTLSARSATLEKVVATAYSDLSRGVSPEVVRAKLRNTTC